MQSENADSVEGSEEGGFFSDAGIGEELAAGREDTKLAVDRALSRRSKDEEAAAAIREAEPDIVRRARALAGAGSFRFPDEKLVRSGDMLVSRPESTDENRWHVLNQVFGTDAGEGRPHVDTFRGRLVDWTNRIVDDRYPMVKLVGACSAAGLKGQSADQIRKAFKEWALTVQSNSLIARFEKKVGEWDGVPRLDMSLIELFECFDTELNREFSRYFWLSVYSRIMDPGCYAPMVLSLFGAQNSGKSFMAKVVCQELLGDKDADSVQLDLSGDKTNFLRQITGSSIIASIGEMTGFNRGDLNKIKDFITRVGDSMDYKYEGHFMQMRQWVAVMDGNKYEGLQRDESGNRRFYPMFVAQLPDKDGQPFWKEVYKVNFDGFRDKIWPIMAECRAWLSANGGVKGYEKFVGSVVGKVQSFSKDEMNKDRGTIRDEGMDTFLVPALKRCEITILNRTKNVGVWIETHEIASRISAASRGRVDVKLNHLRNKMAVLGAEATTIKNVRGYIFRGVMSTEEYVRVLSMGWNGSEDADKEEVPDKVITPFD
jgi:hypothetical protein